MLGVPATPPCRPTPLADTVPLRTSQGMPKRKPAAHVKAPATTVIAPMGEPTTSCPCCVRTKSDQLPLCVLTMEYVYVPAAAFVLIGVCGEGRIRRSALQERWRLRYRNRVAVAILDDKDVSIVETRVVELVAGRHGDVDGHAGGDTAGEGTSSFGGAAERPRTHDVGRERNVQVPADTAAGRMVSVMGDCWRSRTCVSLSA